MNPDELTLENLNKNFEYTLISREIDVCDDLEKLRDIAKCYVKLFLKMQENIISLDL